MGLQNLTAIKHKLLRLFAFYLWLTYFYFIKISIMKNLKTVHLFALTALFLFSSCGMIIRSYIRKDTDNVPPEFGKGKTTILVVKHKNGYNKKIDKILKNHYTGEYIFISGEELKNKYADTISYRYVLDDQTSVTRSTTTSVIPVGPRAGQFSSQPTSAAGRSFHITDRKTNKIHDTGISSGTSWKKILKTYLKKLESTRKENENK